MKNKMDMKAIRFCRIMQYVFAAIAVMAFIRSCFDGFNSLAPMSCVATASAASIIFGRRVRQLTVNNSKD